jgi:hypothetical protein
MFPAHFCMAFAAVLACNASKQHRPTGLSGPFAPRAVGARDGDGSTGGSIGPRQAKALGCGWLAPSTCREQTKAGTP